MITLRQKTKETYMNNYFHFFVGYKMVHMHTSKRRVYIDHAVESLSVRRILRWVFKDNFSRVSDLRRHENRFPCRRLP